MAILNPDGNNEVQEPDPDPDPAQEATGPNPADAMAQGNNLLRDANDLLHSVNDLLQNPVVRKKLENRAQNQETQQRPQTMMGQKRAETPTTPEPQEPAPPKNSERKEKTQKEIRPEDLDLLEIFQAKLIDPGQREELATGIDQIGALVDDDLNGMNTTLAELKEYITSEELEEQITQLRDAGMV